MIYFGEGTSHLKREQGNYYCIKKIGQEVPLMLISQCPSPWGHLWMAFIKDH